MYWLDLVLEQNKNFEKDIIALQDECSQFVKILAAIFEKTKWKNLLVLEELC